MLSGCKSVKGFFESLLRGVAKGELFSIVITIVIAIVIFSLYREIICWFYKTSEIADSIFRLSDKVSMLDDRLKLIEKLLEKQAKANESETTERVEHENEKKFKLKEKNNQSSSYS